MGIRGPVNGCTKKARQMRAGASDVPDLTPPPIVQSDPHALAFWTTHAENLSDNDLLSLADIDSFMVLCFLFSEIIKKKEQGDNILDTVRVFQQMSKAFAMTPTERKKLALSNVSPLARFETTSAFNL